MNLQSSDFAGPFNLIQKLQTERKPRVHILCICRVPEVDPYQSTIGTAMLYQKSIDFWYSYYLYQKSIDFWYSTNCTRSRSTFGTASSCTRSRSTFGTALIVPILDRLLGQPLSLYQSTIGTGLFSYLSLPY